MNSDLLYALIRYFFISFNFVLASCHKGQNKNYFVHDLQKGLLC